MSGLAFGILGILFNFYCIASALAIIVSGFALVRIFRAMPDGKAPGRWLATVGLALGIAETFFFAVYAVGG